MHAIYLSCLEIWLHTPAVIEKNISIGGVDLKKGRVYMNYDFKLFFFK